MLLQNMSTFIWMKWELYTIVPIRLATKANNLILSFGNSNNDELYKLLFLKEVSIFQHSMLQFIARCWRLLIKWICFLKLFTKNFSERARFFSSHCMTMHNKYFKNICLVLYYSVIHGKSNISFYRQFVIKI